jgi:hypothetical protein
MDSLWKACFPVEPRARRFLNEFGAVDERRIAMLIFLHSAPVAQLDRASGYEPEGREFESPRARHLQYTEEFTIVSFCPFGTVVEN